MRLLFPATLKTVNGSSFSCCCSHLSTLYDVFLWDLFAAFSEAVSFTMVSRDVTGDREEDRACYANSLVTSSQEMGMDRKRRCKIHCLGLADPFPFCLQSCSIIERRS
jgi:hypothetical protein